MRKAERRQQTTVTIAKLYRGRLRLERRNGSPRIHARTFIQGKSKVHSTGERTVAAATKAATDWYLELLDRVRKGEHIHGRLFEDAVTAFLAHAEKQDQPGEGQRRNYQQKWDLLKPHFEGVKVSDIDLNFLLDLRQKRASKTTKTGARITPATIRKDLLFVRAVLRFAKEIQHCIDELPEFPSFSGKTWRIKRAGRPYLNIDQWRTLRRLAKARANEPDLNPRTRRQRHELYWFILTCVGAALRVGEAYSLRWCDCEVIRLDDEKHTQAVHMWVLGKHSEGGVREEAWGVYGAVSAFKVMKKARPDAKPEELLFKENHREGIKELLTAAGLRVDNITGRTRDAKSLRPTGISMRLDLGPNPNYRDIAKWARTSPAMIADWYDQTHPEKSVERIVGMGAGARKHREAKKEPTNAGKPRASGAKE